ncbi:MAG: hypothetical protein FWC75_03675 [Oscillospiraceae bacterium]|nr:hypothetical protein [Oscillospiraceae bacterium]
MLLAISSMFLAWQAGFFNGVVTAFPVIGNTLELIRGTGGGQVELRGAAITEAARPLCIVVTDADGARFGVRNNSELRNVVYDRASGIIGEALGSAAAHTQVTQSEWRQALSSHSVFFEYVTPIRLSVLDGWLGARMSDTVEDVRVRRVFVSFGEERSRIYFQDYDSGLYFGADTASTAGKAQDLEIFSPNGVVFAFETQLRGSENAPYLLITQDAYHPDIQSMVAGSQQEILTVVLNVFGHIHESHTTFFSGEDLMSLGAHFNFRIYPDGHAIYRLTYNVLPEHVSALNMGEMIEQARSLVADSIGQKCGDAEVMFESIAYDEGVYVVTFGYYVAGGRVYLFDDRHAARVTFDSGVVVEAELNFRNFSYTGTRTQLLLPQRQALAASDGEFILSYFDTGSEVLYPAWVRLWF